MGKLKNCWEFMKCGREPGGAKVDEKGICPAAHPDLPPGPNHGDGAGRICWTVEGTLCEGTVAEKFTRCLECPFFHLVEDEEGRFLELGVGRSHLSGCGGSSKKQE